MHNRFALVHLAAKRVRQLYRGAAVLVKADNQEIVIALREIAQAKIVSTTPLPSCPKNNPPGAPRRPTDWIK